MDRDVYLNFVKGRWIEGSLGQWDFNRNPAKPNQILGQSTRSSAADACDAIEAAHQARGAWAKVPRPVRGATLFRVAQLMKERLDHFSRTITLEEGKNLSEARGEVQKAINVLEFTASEGRRPTGQVIPSELPNTFLYTTRSPLGVVAVITPWNFPLCIPTWKIAPALLEGNCVIFKPATLTPASAFELTKIFQEAGLPPGVLNLVYGSGSSIGNVIVNDPRVHAISFTGSNAIGKELNTLASKRLARVQLEMGGKNPIIVLADADLEQAVNATIQGAFGSTGQRCTATSRVIVEEAIQEKFTQELLTRTRSIKVGNGITDPTAMGPIVDENQYQLVLRAIEKGKWEGARLICGGEAVGLNPAESGYFIAPTLFDQVKPEMSLATQEIFGPVLSIISVSNFREAIEVANQVEYGLSSSIYTKDIQTIMNYATDIETGILHVNSSTVGGEVQAPFGGTKATGLGGREMGSMGPEFFCEVKTV
jgi:acyl-CoA reductase-like NAD-dependent aldehyde dehydrogenase